MIKSLFFVFILLSPATLFAQESLTATELQEILSVKIRFANHISYNPLIVRAVESQNEDNISLNEIKNRDQIWAGSNNESKALIRAITNNEVAKYFRRRVESNPAITEVFLTDNQGANVAAYPPTGDYWQGDEEKWIASFNNGNGTLFIGPIERDESTNMDQVQISSPILSGDETIGVLVMGVTVDYIAAQ